MGGHSATTDTVADPSTKNSLYETSGAASVNMEDYWAASAASAAGVPFASVRAVLDVSSVALPRYVTGGTGGIARTLAGLVVHPARLPSMVRLARPGTHREEQTHPLPACCD